LFAGRDVAFRAETRTGFLGCENDPRALCFAGALVRDSEDIRRAAELGDAFAQAEMARQTVGEDCFRLAEKSAAQGERDGFFSLGACLRDGTACEQDPERAKENFLVAAELGDVQAMVHFGCFFDKDDSQRFVWFGRAARNGGSVTFWNETSYQIRNFKFRKCRFRNWASSERTY
jgi:TPR repeat protein